jgi:hypothetical protein
VDGHASVEEEVDEFGRGADEDSGDQRRHHRTPTLGRLMHILRVTANGPQNSSQEQRYESANQGPRGDSISN